MNTYNYIMRKFSLDENTKSPVKLRFKRNDLGGLFKELGYETGAEIGVYTGHYSEVLCQGNPGVKMYCIDPWKVYETEEIEPYAQDQKALSKFYAEAKKRLAPYNCEIIRKTSMEAVKDFKPDSLDFVYVDANHDFENVLEDLEEWSKIVRKGGMVAGHDYGHFKHKDRNLGTKRAIDAHVIINDVKMLFLVNRNYQTTWFYVK